jgi:phospholipid/cholesterol/gamma-HCH transport system substrate-binding protein
MTLSPARAAGVGLFVIIGLVTFGVGIFMIGDRQMAFADKFTIYTEFTRITGLQPGAVVRVSGARAGAVREITPPADPAAKFRVRLEVAEELHPLVRADSIASIETEGLVGGAFLSVSTGSAESPMIAPRASIPSREPFQIADLLQQMGDTVGKVNVTIDLLTGQLDQALTSIVTTVDNANGLILEVGHDVKVMAHAGAKIADDVSVIASDINAGRGTVGKLVKDDELYQRAATIARSAETVATDTRDMIQKVRGVIDRFDGAGGSMADITTDLRLTLTEARQAMVGLGENMEALKRNFLFRGFFNNRGYFNLANLSPAEYRGGALTRNGARRPLRIWLSDQVLFESAGAGSSATSWRLSDGGKVRLESALSGYLDRLNDSILVIEGYAQGASRDEQYLASRAKAAAARDYLIDKFSLDVEATGLMPLGRDVQDGPDGPAVAGGDVKEWGGVALAVFVATP